MLSCRLMHFDLDTLYELHYQMITLGKVDPFLMHCTSAVLTHVLVICHA